MEDSSLNEENGRAHDAKISEWNDSFTQNDDDVGFWKGELWHEGLDTAAERKAVKAARKSARNHSKFDLPAALDLRHIEEVLHPESEGLPLKGKVDDQGMGNDTSMFAPNLVSHGHSFDWSNLRKGVYDRKFRNQPSCSPNGATGHSGSMDAIQDILTVFRIELAPARNSKERKSLLSKLQVAIRNTKNAHSNEQAETMQRMAGYWRYANKRTYNFMVRTNQIWDWETGEKLLEVDEDDIAEDDGEDEDTLSGATQVTAVSQSQEDGQNSKLNFDECGVHSKPMLSDSFDTSNQSDDQIRKDDRVLDKKIRPASPPRDTGPSPSPRYCSIERNPKSKAPWTKKPQDTLSNAFSALKFEIPAPCDDPQLPTTEEAIVQRSGPKCPVYEQEGSFPPLTSIEARADAPSKGPTKQKRVLNIIAPPKANPSVSHAVMTSKSKSTGGAKRLVHIGIVATRASGDTTGVKPASDSWTDVIKGRKGRR